MEVGSSTKALPKIDIRVEVPSTWWELFLRDVSSRSDLCCKLGAEVGATMQILGVPGTPAISISAVHDDELLPNRLIRMFVNGRWCPFPADVWSIAWNYAVGSTQETSITLVDIFDKFNTVSITSGAIYNHHEILVHACRGALQTRPSALLGDQSFASFLSDLNSAPHHSSQNAHWLSYNVLRGALNQALDLGISIADKETIDGIMRELKLHDLEDVGERIIKAFIPKVINVYGRRSDLKQLTTTCETDTMKAFLALRKRLYRQTGLNFPNFRFVVDDRLQASSLAVSINNLVTLPRMFAAFASNICMDAFGVIEDTVCLNAARFVDVENVEEAISSAWCPVLAENVRSRFSSADIAYVFRRLIDEGLSIRPIRALLDGLLEAKVVIADPFSVTLLEVAVVAGEQRANQMSKRDQLVAALRSKLRQHITAKYAWPENRVRIYRNDSFHEVVGGGAGDAPNSALSFEWVACQRLLNDVHDAIGRAGETSKAFCIMSQNPFRQNLEEVIRTEFPRLPVLTNEELSPTVDIQVW